MALTSEFTAAVRRQSQHTAEVLDSEILAWGDEAIQSRFLPLLRKMRSEFGVRKVQLPITNGRASIPDRAQVAGVRLVQWLQAGILVPLPQLSPEQDFGTTGGSVPVGWYFDAGTITLVPSSATGTLVVRYFQRPSKMILDTTAADTSEIATVSEGAINTTITFNVATTLVRGDIVSAGPAHHIVLPGVVNSAAGAAIYANAVYGTTDSDRPVAAASASRTIIAGDRVALNGRTPFVPLPEELFSALVLATSAVSLQGLAYLEEANAAWQAAEAAEARARDMLAPRSEGNAKVMSGGIRGATFRRQWVY